MSLPDFSTQSCLFSTAALSASLFAETDRYRLFAKIVYPRLARTRAQLAAAYCQDNGRVAVEPVLLLGVSLLQYLDGMPDRQAVEMVRYHAGWNFALNRQLGDEVFHHTTLVNFRARLLEKGLTALAFQSILEALVEAGWVARQSRQRLDSTQMFGRVSRMSKLDCVRESLRLALQEVAKATPEGARPAGWGALWERYVESQTDYRASSETLARKLTEAGQDAYRVLAWLRLPAQAELAQGESARLLARVFGEQFEVVQSPTASAPEAGGLAAAIAVAPAAPSAPASGGACPAQTDGMIVEPKAKGTLSSDRVQNPHEPEATYASKGEGKAKKEHVGYKVQVAESVTEAALEAGEPTRNFITGIVTHAAYESDEAGAQKMAAEQAAMGLGEPPVQYVDAAYVSAAKLAQAQAEGRELIGPAPAAPDHVHGRYTTDRFGIDVERRQALCPAGKMNTQCSRLEEKQTGKVSYRFEWSTHCENCPLRAQCVAPDHKHRSLVVGEHHTALQARRREQITPEFMQRMKHRNAIEGTQSELVRAHGLRRARYRGLGKARLQNYLAGAACNVKRWLRREIWNLRRAASPATPAVAG